MTYVLCDAERCMYNDGEGCTLEEAEIKISDDECYVFCKDYDPIDMEDDGEWE